MWKKLLQWLKNPHGWQVSVVFLFAAATIGATVALLLVEPTGIGFDILSYTCYLLSALSLGYAVYAAVCLIKRFLSAVSDRNTIVRKAVNNYEFRTYLFAVLSLILTMAIAVFDCVTSFLFRSVWYGALAVYYGVLVAMRSGVLAKTYYGKKFIKNTEDAERAETAAYRTCGILLIVLTLALSGAVLQMVRNDKAFSKPGFTIYVFAVYALCKLGISAYNFFKSKHYRGYVNILRNISFADALVALLALQTALLQQFGGEGVNAARANAVTGGIVCAIILGMSIFMIVRGKSDSDQRERVDSE